MQNMRKDFLINGGRVTIAVTRHCHGIIYSTNKSSCVKIFFHLPLPRYILYRGVHVTPSFFLK